MPLPENRSDDQKGLFREEWSVVVPFLLLLLVVLLTPLLYDLFQQ